ncbi:MAG: hypothetical protein K2X77_13630 [Candidatus Obscuribacterales bacterium]|nr:hypothetical protein [Candidatus Obscuribacterales bacterium]
MKKLAHLTLSIALGCLCIPSVFAAEFASDSEYAAALGNQAMGGTGTGPANPLQSSGATGLYGYTTDTTWQDALNLPAFGNANANLGQTFQGNMADRFLNQPLLTGQTAEQGLMAIQGRHNRAACGQWGSGGFYGAGSRSAGMKYRGLPPTSTTPCNIHTAE